jgi:hypothetical protein
MKKETIIIIFTISIVTILLILFFNHDFLISLKNFTGKIISSNASINLTIEPIILINFSIDNINWGSGSVDATATSANLDTFGNVTNGSWNPVSSGFVIDNIGNVNISLSFSSLNNAESFIGGDNPSYQYQISNVGESACIPPALFQLDTFYEFPDAGTDTLICDYFLPGESINFDLNLTIPYNSNAGTLSDIISVSLEQA